MQQFNNTRHDFEIQLENASVVQLCEDEPQDSIPRALYHVSQSSAALLLASFWLLNIIWWRLHQHLCLNETPSGHQWLKFL